MKSSNDKNNKSGYNRGGYKRDNRNSGYSRDNRSENKPGGFKKFDYKKPDNRFSKDKGEKKFERDRKFDKNKPAGRFDGKFTKKSEKKDYKNYKDNRDNKFEKKFVKKPGNFNKTDRKVNKRAFTEDNNINIKLVESVEDEKSGMVYGRNAVIELLKSDKTVDKLYVQSGQREGSITMIVAEAIKKSVPVIEADKPKLDSMINNSAHQGVIALASEKDYCSVDDILAVAEERGEKPFILVADKIMDPHNLGAIIRTAECAGVHGIIIPKRNAAGVSPIVAKTSAGASVHMAIAKVANIATALEELKEKGVWIFASAAAGISGDAINYYDADYSLPAALVVGNEGEGLAQIIIKNSDFLVRIPMSGKIESLNVSCASAILLYEAAKQRIIK